MTASASDDLVTRETVITLPDGQAFLLPAGLRVFNFQPREEIRSKAGANPPGFQLLELPLHLRDNPALVAAGIIHLRPDQVQRKGDLVIPRGAVYLGKLGAALAVVGLVLALWPLSLVEALGIVTAFLGFNALCLFHSTPRENREIAEDYARQRQPVK